MPNGYEIKKYNKHKYLKQKGTVYCKYSCGCWVTEARSGGPIGLDPFGKCPNNPIDGEQRTGDINYHDVVNQRISKLESRIAKAERDLEKVNPDKKELAKQLAVEIRAVNSLNSLMNELRRLLAQ